MFAFISVSTSASFIALLLTCLLCSVRTTTFAFNEEHGIPNLYDTVEVRSLLPSSTCSSSPPTGSKGEEFLRVTHKHGPCSPLKHGRNKTSPTITDIFHQDQLRARFLLAKLFSQSPGLKAHSKSTVATVPAKAASADVGRINYVATFGIGTPAKQIALELDTGSNLAWTQCTECKSKQCFKQRDPLFDPSKSSTYGTVKCPTPLCSAAANGTGSPTICASSKCQYDNGYGDGSYSIGYLSTEKLTLTPSDVFNNFKFGCGINNTNPAFSDGVVGLARDPISIVQQLKHKYGDAFSYCFPSKTSQVGFFKFGAAGGVSKNIKYTPLNNDRVGQIVYSVTMTAIILGGKTLPIATKILKSPTILDSGTVYNFIEPKAYRVLRAAFRKEMSGYPKVNPENDSVQGILDTCYSLGNHKAFRIPKMSVVFAGGSTVNLATSGVVVPVNSSVVCLAYASNTILSPGLTILGNTLQHTLEVVYEIGNGRVGFREGACP